jgi:predicted aminopeptidase
MTLRITAMLAAGACLFMTGCANLSYYAGSIKGQLDVWRREQPAEKLIASESTPDLLRERLRSALRIREFASRELALPDNRSYRIYADLGRPFITWNVFAAPEFSVEPVEWCFFVAGCVKYRGYFSEAEANAVADDLRRQGYDVFVGGVPAYSTLGYFADPLLNTFMHYPPPEMARLIFHELAHQVVYVRDDTMFNESFAVSVEREGVRRWIAENGTPEDQARFDALQERRAQFAAMIRRYHGRLETLYRTRIAPEAMRGRKAELFAGLKADYEALKASWGGFSGFDRWLSAGPNNALLASIAIYTQHVPAFTALFAERGGDFPSFYEAVRNLAQLPPAERKAALGRLAPSSAPGPSSSPASSPLPALTPR